MSCTVRILTWKTTYRHVFLMRVVLWCALIMAPILKMNKPLAALDYRYYFYFWHCLLRMRSQRLLQARTVFLYTFLCKTMNAPLTAPLHINHQSPNRCFLGGTDVSQTSRLPGSDLPDLCSTAAPTPHQVRYSEQF